MTIEGSFYKLYPCNEYSLNFDLELLYDIGGKNPRKEYKNVGYGYTLEGAIKAIVMYAINKKYGDEAIPLKQFLDEFKKEVYNLRSELRDFGLETA